MDYERILLVKPEVFVYKIPPRTSARGYRAADWNLDKPDWTLRLRIIAKDKKCLIRLEDKISGELFCECPVDAYPGSAVESVSDSSRYFVFRIQDPSGRSAFLGIGYGDRSDSFDMNVSLQEHFKWVATSEQIVREDAADNKPKLDLAFKEGQMIKINIGKKSSTTTSSGSLGSSGAIPNLLPPPPGASASVNRVVPPPSASAKVKIAPSPQASDLPISRPVANDLPNEDPGLLDFDPISFNSKQNSAAISAANEWGDYKSSSTTQPAATDDSWMNF